MDTEIIAILSTMAGTFVGNMGLILWCRVDSIAKQRQFESKIEANMSQNEINTQTILNAIQADIKDFRVRLCALEGENRNK